MTRAFVAILTIAGSLLAADRLDQVDQVDVRTSIADVAGVIQRPFAIAAGKLAALFFITNDCPISNLYAAEIRRICERNARLACYLDYVDPTLNTADVVKHKAQYNHGDYPAIFDRKQLLAKAVGATVTPEVALIDSTGSIAYRGRIDDSYVSLGRRRMVVTDHTLQDAIEAKLAGKPVAQSRTKAVGCFITPVELLTPGPR